MSRPSVSRTTLLLLLGLVAAIIATLIQTQRPDNCMFRSIPCLSSLCRLHNPFTASDQAIAEGAKAIMTAKRTPVYFLSHGGPTIFEDTQHPVYPKLQSIGREITQNIKPKAIVVLSAHWQGSRDTIEVNTATSMPLIYDFYGFPPHFYQAQFPNRGSPELAERVMGLLGNAGIKSKGVERGLDHGVWASFMCAFNPKENPLDIPIVQVSLFDSDFAEQHIALGRALAPLRDEGILIIGSGMAVHNLRDMRMAFGVPGALPYAYSFDAALKEAVEQPVESRQKAMAGLLERSDARKAHPSFEHLLPVHVGVGAAGEDRGEQIWTMAEGSLSWGMFKFGEGVGA